MTSSAPVSSRDRIPSPLFLLLWMLANTLPCLLLWFLEINGLGSTIWFLLSPVVGITQWLLLRRYITGLRWWPLITTAGAFVGAIGFVTFIYSMFVAPLTIGLGVAIAQWLYLKPKLANASNWIGGIIGGAVVGTVLGNIAFSSLDGIYGTDKGSLFGMIVAIEVSSSLITGMTLLGLLQPGAEETLELTE